MTVKLVKVSGFWYMHLSTNADILEDETARQNGKREGPNAAPEPYFYFYATRRSRGL